ncbi:MAG: 2-oxoglutarate and iron-dependent oxygenase domain-containing protein [Chloroflexota bacterium]
MTQFQIPVVDITPFREGDEAGSNHVIKAVSSACEEIGFFTITGHGIPSDLIMQMYGLSRTFFDLPTEQKLTVKQTGDELGGLMYFPMMAESLAASLGDKRPGDFKESLDFGPGFMGDAWPTALPTLKQVWYDYYAAMSDLATCLRHIFAAAIGLPKTYFDDKFDRHHSSLRVLNYPEQQVDPLPGQLRAGAHSDYDFLTILWADEWAEDSPGGLQAQHRNGDWIDVPTIPDSFIVNIGDAMMRWTNDRWISTVHRVVNPSTEARLQSRRQSIPFFHGANKDAVIECLDAFCDATHPPKYEPITYGEYTQLKYRQAHGVEELKS